MAVEKDIIVALELATTAIRAIAGQRLPDGSMQVLAYSEENASNCIRKGVIDNIDKTTQAIGRVLAQLEFHLCHKIARVFVGISGQSLRSVQNSIKRQFNEKTQVTNDLIDQLMDTNSGVVYTDSRILEVVPQEFVVGSRAVPEIVGMQVEQFDAKFLNIIARSSLSENIEKCVNGAGYEVAEILITPISLANSILNASEKRSGCALVDIGADTTSVSVYSNNILRKLIVLPIGSHNATRDVASYLNCEIEEAEALKLKFGSAWVKDTETAKNNIITISLGRSHSESDICSCVEARYDEILLNVLEQLKGHADKLTSGIVFAGGGSQIRSLTDAFQHISKSDKQIRVVKSLPQDVCVEKGVSFPLNGQTNSVVALLLCGDQNCVILSKPAETPVEPAETANGTAVDPVTEPVAAAVEEPTNQGDDVVVTDNATKKKWWQKMVKMLTEDEDRDDAEE